MILTQEDISEITKAEKEILHQLIIEPKRVMPYITEFLNFYRWADLRHDELFRAIQYVIFQKGFVKNDIEGCRKDLELLDASMLKGVLKQWGLCETVLTNSYLGEIMDSPYEHIEMPVATLLFYENEQRMR